MIDRKHDPRSVLKSQSADRQHDIAEYSVKHSLQETVQWLAADGLVLSAAALSNWLSDYRLAQELRIRGNLVEQLIEEMKKEMPGMLPEETFKAGQFLFSGLTMQAKDERGWGVIQRLEIQKERNQLAKQDIELERQKWEFKASEAALKILPALRQIDADSSLDATQKINAVRNALFGVVAP